MKKITGFILGITVLTGALSAQTKEELAKVDTVLSKMSPRARRELIITDKSAFVKDLKIVLEEEKKYSKSDISRMSTADLKTLAPTLGIEVTEESTGAKLKEEIIAKLGL